METAPDPDYLALIRRHPLRSIRTEAEYQAAVTMMDGLLRYELTEGEDEYLAALSDLVMVAPQEQAAKAKLEEMAVRLNTDYGRTAQGHARWAIDTHGITAAGIARSGGLPLYVVESVIDGTCSPSDETVTAIKRGVEGELLDSL